MTISIYLTFLFLCQIGMYNGVTADLAEGGIEFFGGENYRDSLYKIYTNTTTECHNFPRENVTVNVGSIKTKQCWILYKDPDCQSLFTEKITTDVSWKHFHQIGSFQLCTEQTGGSSLQVAITDLNELDGQSLVLEDYKNVCDCIDIPDYILKLDKWSIDNNGNDMMAYYEKGCEVDKYKPLYIPAGHSEVSREIYKYEKIDLDQGRITDSTDKLPEVEYGQVNENTEKKVSRIQSFSPNLNSSYFRKSCVKFDAAVIKFEIDDKAEFEETDLEIEMFNNVFRNDRSNLMSSTYFITKNVQEVFKVEVDSSIKEMSMVMVEHDFEVESNFDQSIFREFAFREVLRKAYSKTCENSLNFSSLNATLKSLKTFSVKQVMNVAACTEHKVSAHVNMLRNDRIGFKALMKVSGYIGERKMGTGEVKRFMDRSLEYKGDYDQNTVMAHVNGVVGLKFGASLVVEGEDIAIPECVAYNQLLTCPACEVCY